LEFIFNSLHHPRQLKSTPKTEFLDVGRAAGAFGNVNHGHENKSYKPQICVFCDYAKRRNRGWHPFSSETRRKNDSQDPLVYPGPTPLLPAAQFAMAAADMHHRTPEFARSIKRFWRS